MNWLRLRLALGTLLLCSLLAFLTAGCGNRRMPEIATIEFEPRGIVIRLTVPAAALSATVQDQTGKLMGATTLGSGKAQELRLTFPWQEGATYQVLVIDSYGNELRREILAPAKPVSPLRAELQIPFGRQGQGGETGNTSLMVLGGTATATLVLENLEPTALIANVQVILPTALQAIDVPSGWDIEQGDRQQILHGTVSLNVQGETWFGMFKVQAGNEPVDEVQSVPVQITYERPFASQKRTGEERTEGRVKLISQSELVGLLAVERVDVPTSMTGKVDARWQPGTIILPDPAFDGLRSVLQLSRQSMDTDKPVAYVAVTIRNHADADIISLVRMQVTDVGGEQPLPQFAAIDPHGGSTPYSDNIIVVPAQSSGVALLRLYADESTLSGVYSMQIEASLFGTDTTIDQQHVRLNVTHRNLGPALLTGVMMLVASMALLWLVLAGRRFLRSFGVRTLVTVALFGASGFVSVNVPNVVFDDLVRALLGPFSFVVNGLFSHFMRAVLLICLVAILPRPGVAALAMAVRFLLSSMVLGRFTLVGMLSTTAEALILEASLYLSGATRGREGHVETTWGRRRLALIALVCGIGQTIDSYIGFNLMMFLSRLYYAGWYITTYLIVCGLGYSALGAYAGGRLGLQLRKVVD